MTDDYSLMVVAFESGHSSTSKSLANPMDNSNQVASARGESRQMSRLGWDSPFSSSSSPQSRLRGESYNQELIENKENVNDEKVPIMDSKRFTPNLHASLVSEILSLRREIEAKNNTLTGLEESLSNSKIDNGRLKATVTGQEQEVRSAKKQMQLLESGTLAALGDLAKERDRAVENLAETRKRLETSRETIRVREADASRSQAIWEKDKQSWDNEKRNLERKVHVAEGRLKVMVAEVAAIQASTQPAPGSDHEEGVGETWFSNWSDIISTRSSSVRGRHHLSEMSNKTYDTDELANLRASIVAPSAEIEGTPSNPLTLAEELNFDEADDDDHARGHEPDDEEKMSPTALSEEDSLLPSRLSIQFQDKKARRVLGLPMDRTDMHVFEPPAVEGNSLTLRDKLAVRQRKITSYHDSATQFTPPSSPTFSALDLEALAEKDSLKAPSVENTANQSRKRVSAVAMPQEQICLPKIDLQAGQQTASVACQTIPQPISPPLVPIVALEPLFPEPSTLFAPEMKPACTQTDNNMMATSESASTRKHSTMAIPIIAIHPPGSRPNSSHTNVVLPPHTKNVACQTSSEPLFQMRSVAVQTGEIRIDKRPLKIPPRTMSVATPSKPGSQNGQSYRAAASQMTRTNLKNPPPVEPFRPRQRPSNIRTHGSFPGRDDDRSINHSQLADSRHPVKHESLFAGFSDQEGPEDNVISDDDDFANVAPIRKTLSKVQNSWKLVPAPMDPDLGPRELGRPISDIQELDDTSEACAHEMQVAVAKQVMASSANQPKADQKFSVSSRLLKHPNIRKATLISSGAVAHTRKRSPSEPGPSMETTSAPPPFPVPTRSSSRKIPLSSSEGALSPTPYKTSFITGSRDRPPIRPPSKNPLRKVRSAAAVPKFARSITRQEDLQSPTTASPTSTPLDSPRLPLTSRGDGATQHINVTLEQSVPEPSIESPSQTTSVVDAIAQTMVGEWMWKYVRKRKSFGITDPPQVEFEEGRNSGESGSGIRHKRWVWLAPYERAVLWSSKQPTNGSALLGKAGRKRKSDCFS